MRTKYVIPKRKYLKQLSKVLDLLVNHNSKDAASDIYHNYIDYSGYRKLNMGRSFGSIVKKCIATHRYGAASMMLNVVAQELNMVHQFFFKAASVLLENTPTTTCEEFFSFVRHVQCLIDLSKPETLLEYLMFVLRRNDIDGVHNLKVLISDHRHLRVQNPIIDPLLKVYMGLFDYIEWCQLVQKNSNDSNAQLLAEKTIDCFKEVTLVPGQFDVFVLKLVEMLEFMDRIEEIRDVLAKYVLLNPEHLNSHIYLYTYLQKYNPTSPVLLETLETIAKMSPSDHRILVLAEMYQSSYPRKTLKCLFLFLDYSQNSNEQRAWELMYEVLVKLLTRRRNSDMIKITSRWSERKYFWPHLHFNVNHVDCATENEAMVLVYKASVLYALVESPHPYIQAVSDKLGTFSEELKENLRNLMLKLDNLNT